MNGYERIQKVIRNEIPDRVPIMLHNFMSAAREMGYTMKEFRNSPEIIADVFVETAVKYGLDGILTDMDTAMEAHAMGALVDFPENEPARVAGPSGKTFDEIIAKVEPHRLVSDERVQVYLEAIRLIKKQVAGEIFVRGNADQGPFSLAMLLYGMEDFLADLLDDDKTERIRYLIDKCYEVHIAFHKMVKDAGADMTSFGDSSCGPDLISRDMYLKYAKPLHVKMKNELDCHGISCVCHICGKLDVILEDVAEIGFTGMEIDYKTSFEKARNCMKGKSIIFGPIDPSGIFFFGNKEDVRRETERVLEIFKDVGLVIGAGCALPPCTPENNIRTFVDTVIRKGIIR